MPPATATDLAYTIGLIAGEGSFFVTLTRDDRYRYGVYYGPKFTVTMGTKCREMLERQRDLYGLGTVNEASKGHQWVLSSRGDCHELRELIDGYLAEHDAPEFTSTPKYTAYRRWCDALDLLEPGRRLTKAEILELAELRDTINYIAAPTRISADEIRRIVDRVDE